MAKIQHCGFISLLYSIGEKPLNMWSKHISPDGRVRRVIDEIFNGDKIIEITGPHDDSISTNITCPADPTDVLNIKLPILVLVIKNLELSFKLEFQILDKEKCRRKFTFSTEEITPKVNVTTAQLSLKLEENWNTLEINFQILCKDIFGTDYDALQRIIIYPNCRIRRVYLQDRHYEYHETPVELCQAFFDMYMLKWGIYLVDRSSQTEEFQSETLHNLKSQATISLYEKSSCDLSELKQEKNKGTSRNGTINKLKKKAEDKITNKITTKMPSIYLNVNELPKESLTLPHLEKSKYLQMLENPFISVVKKEGNIFSKWPYKLDDLNQGTTNVSTINDSIINKVQNLSHDPNKKIKDTFTTNGTILNTEKTNFQKQNMLSIKSIINEVQKVREQLNNKNSDSDSIVKLQDDSEIIIPQFVELEAESLEKTPRNKFLTSDFMLNEFLKCRFKANKKLFERLKKKGLTMAEVELSIYNSKNRRNCYGQGKLIESCKGSVNKASGCEEISLKVKDFEKFKKRDPLKFGKELDVILLPFKNYNQNTPSTNLFTIPEPLNSKKQDIKHCSKMCSASVNYLWKEKTVFEL